MDILDTQPNLTSMVLCHDQQIKDLAAHLLELKQLITPMMEFKKRAWVGLTRDEKFEIINRLLGEDWVYTLDAAEDLLRKKNT